VTRPISITPKAWGESHLMFKEDGVELLSLYMTAGGYTSTHRHNSHLSTLYVVSGMLEVYVWDKGEHPAHHVLGVGDSLVIKPGQRHFLYCVHNAMIREAYYSPWKHIGEDIVRDDKAGLLPEDQRGALVRWEWMKANKGVKG